MGRRLAAVFGYFFAIPLADAAPQLRDKPGRTFFPTAVGTTWVYVDEYMDRSTECTEVLTNAKRKGQVTEVTIAEEVREEAQQGLRRYRKLAVRPDGLFLIEQDRHVQDPAICLIRLPHRQDDRWDWKHTFSWGDRLKATWTTADPEEVQVPAGTFPAFPVKLQKVHFTSGQALEGEPEVDWYVPNIGLVRRTTGEHSRRLLKSFSPGSK